MAKRIPGKEEFYETIRYFSKMIEKTGVHLHLNTRVGAEELLAGGFDDVILATGVSPRKVSFEGADHPKVLSYVDVLYHAKEVGHSVAIIGSGGIGFDVAEYLSHDKEHTPSSMDIAAFMEEWGVDMKHQTAGAVLSPEPAPSPRKIYLLKRSSAKHGAGLGKTTGWIHRASLNMKGVEMIRKVQYEKVDDQGLHLTVKGEPMLLEVDHVVICAGQEPLAKLAGPLEAGGKKVHLLGGAKEARELDAKRAIDEGARLAAQI